MAINFATYTRLEPRPHERNIEAGFEASINDPVWFLGRQWQMGEHQGENASSPVSVPVTSLKSFEHSSSSRILCFRSSLRVKGWSGL